MNYASSFNELINSMIHTEQTTNLNVLDHGYMVNDHYQKLMQLDCSDDWLLQILPELITK
jgi:hypothetical protein